MILMPLLPANIRLLTSIKIAEKEFALNFIFVRIAIFLEIFNFYVIKDNLFAYTYVADILLNIAGA